MSQKGALNRPVKIYLVGRSVFTEGSTRCGCVSIFLVYPLWLCLAWSEKYDIKAMIHFECNVTIPVVTAHALAARVEGKVPARAESKIGRDRQKLSNVFAVWSRMAKFRLEITRTLRNSAVEIGQERILPAAKF